MRRFLIFAAATLALGAGLPALGQPTPGAGNPGQQAPNIDFQQKLLGTWYFEGMTGPSGYQVWTTIRVEYMADSTYRGAITQQMPGLPPSSSALGGRYAVQPASADSFVLTHIPFQGYGRDQSEYKFVDDNTLLNINTNATSRRAS